MYASVGLRHPFLNVKYDTPTLSPPNQLASTVPWNQGSCRTLLWCPLWSDSQLYIVSSDVRIIITYLISSLLFFNWKVETGSPGWRATMLNMYPSSNTPVNLWPWTCRSQGEWLINAGMLLGKGTITNGPVSEDPLSRRAGDNLQTQSYAHQTVDHPQERDIGIDCGYKMTELEKRIHWATDRRLKLFQFQRQHWENIKDGVDSWLYGLSWAPTPH